MYKVKLLKNYDLEKERIFQDTAKPKSFKGKKRRHGLFLKFIFLSEQGIIKWQVVDLKIIVMHATDKNFVTRIKRRITPVCKKKAIQKGKK